MEKETRLCLGAPAARGEGYYFHKSKTLSLGAHCMHCRLRGALVVKMVRTEDAHSEISLPGMQTLLITIWLIPIRVTKADFLS